MNLRVTRRARRHLDKIADYISQDNAKAAERVGARIRHTIELLCSFPQMGHRGTLSGTSEMSVPGLPYVVVYRVEADGGTLVILGVYHTARRRPGQ